MNLVFVIDDSAEYGFLLKFFMGRFLPECQIRIFGGGQEFIDAITVPDQQDQIDPLPEVVLIDLFMTPMDGYELLKFIKSPDSVRFAGWKDVPIAMNSSDTSGIMVQKCYDLGATAFLRKSVELSDLHKLKDFLKNHFHNE